MFSFSLCLSLLFIIVNGNEFTNAPMAESTGGYEWNAFIKEVMTTVADVTTRKESVEKDIIEHPDSHKEQALELQQLIDKIIHIQDMIDYEFLFRDQLDQPQRETLERYKNQSLRLRQELTQLKEKLK